ncbi:SHOCT domain-containing protein [Clostridium sp. cel8]|jgi:putative membrane protein|uniref:SHOCT domain-containing protein n=1 Tax=unclassified Clostridium TaxID=2614128 RepID=UPI0015F438DD|nr:SHOCT domain-containing protein [Clostridium sp. cel8]MBA5851545.1 SHOCT domain-containing protein [Clostridium sp. cel8]
MFCGGYGFGGPSSMGHSWIYLTIGFRLLIFIGLIFFAIKLFKTYSNKSNNAINILNEKFATGEISEEEYLKRKTILSQKN